MLPLDSDENTGALKPIGSKEKILFCTSKKFKNLWKNEDPVSRFEPYSIEENIIDANHPT